MMMFDRKAHQVLLFLQSQCPNGAYKVLDKKDIADAMPRRYAMSLQEVSNVVDFLQRNEYIVIKYEDSEQMCVSLTPRAFSVLLKDSAHTEKPRFDKKVYFYVALLSFAGAFLGVVLAKFLGF